MEAAPACLAPADLLACAVVVLGTVIAAGTAAFAPFIAAGLPPLADAVLAIETACLGLLLGAPAIGDT